MSALFTAGKFVGERWCDKEDSKQVHLVQKFQRPDGSEYVLPACHLSDGNQKWRQISTLPNPAAKHCCHQCIVISRNPGHLPYGYVRTTQ